ncbi:MAG: 3-methyl-2-oxobutanoate hydroxymethyltransferase [Sphingomonadales bacterium]
MSAQTELKAITIPAIKARKGGEPVVCLTAYTTPMAAVLDPHVDLLLVGDSVGMVLHGLPSTVGVTLEMMIMHTAAVVRGARHACVIVDMPFGSYEESPQVAYRNSARVMRETGCAGVKLEGGREMAETIAFLTARGIPVMGHVGLLPQSLNISGGYRSRGRRKSEWDPVIADARAIDEAGVFATVIEAVAEPLGERITAEVSNPTIGIGASPACDGQILVTEDLLGLSPRVPKFVKRYAEIGADIEAAVTAYAEDVKSRRFPGPGHTYGMRE